MSVCLTCGTPIEGLPNQKYCKEHGHGSVYYDKAHQKKRVEAGEFRYNTSITRKCKLCDKPFTIKHDIHSRNKVYCKTHQDRNKRKAPSRLHLLDDHIKDILSRRGKLTYAQITPELIETKRKQLWLLREKSRLTK